jgi:ferredoxin
MIRSALAVFSAELESHRGGDLLRPSANERAGRPGEGAVTGAVRFRIRIDPIGCDGRGYCAELLPEMIALDDWGFPLVLAAEVPCHLLESARHAESLCPRLALHIDAGLGASEGGPSPTPRGTRRRLRGRGR